MLSQCSQPYKFWEQMVLCIMNLWPSSWLTHYKICRWVAMSFLWWGIECCYVLRVVFQSPIKKNKILNHLFNFRTTQSFGWRWDRVSWYHWKYKVKKSLLFSETFPNFIWEVMWAYMGSSPTWSHGHNTPIFVTVLRTLDGWLCYLNSLFLWTLLNVYYVFSTRVGQLTLKEGYGAGFWIAVSVLVIRPFICRY